MQSPQTADAHNLVLKDIGFFSFDNKGNRLSVSSPNTSVWIAIGSFELISIKNTIADNQSKHFVRSKRFISHHIQRQAVRQLFYSLMSQLLQHCQFYYLEPSSINLFSTCGLSLQQSSYPYRILPFNYYICFTHSADKVSCAIHKHRPIGIDIEKHPVSLSVAQRFYDKQEIRWLLSLDVEIQPQALNLLWMLKEATIKISQKENKHLLSGLKTNMLLPAKQLLQLDKITDDTNFKNEMSKLSININSGTNLGIKVFALDQYIYLYQVDIDLVVVW